MFLAFGHLLNKELFFENVFPGKTNFLCVEMLHVPPTNFYEDQLSNILQ